MKKFVLAAIAGSIALGIVGGATAFARVDPFEPVPVTPPPAPVVVPTMTKVQVSPTRVMVVTRPVLVVPTRPPLISPIR